MVDIQHGGGLTSKKMERFRLGGVRREDVPEQ
jgi:hypothetical protein